MGKAKKTAKKTPVRKRKRPEIPPEWARAIDDIVASAIAEDHVAGRPVKRRAQQLRGWMQRLLPNAVWIFDNTGHPQSKTDCHCRSYALLRADAAVSAPHRGLPPEMLYHHAIGCFDHYVDNRN